MCCFASWLGILVVGPYMQWAKGLRWLVILCWLAFLFLYLWHLPPSFMSSYVFYQPLSDICFSWVRFILPELFGDGCISGGCLCRIMKLYLLLEMCIFFFFWPVNILLNIWYAFNLFLGFCFASFFPKEIWDAEVCGIVLYWSSLGLVFHNGLSLS